MCMYCHFIGMQAWSNITLYINIGIGKSNYHTYGPALTRFKIFEDIFCDDSFLSLSFPPPLVNYVGVAPEPQFPNRHPITSGSDRYTRTTHSIMSALQTQQLYGEQSTDNVGPSFCRLLHVALIPGAPPCPARL